MKYDGVIEVTLPDATNYYASINPSCAGTQNGKKVTYRGLSTGEYTVQIFSRICPDKKIFNPIRLRVNKEKPCTFPVNISIVSKWTCNNPVTVLKATASGGTPPYSYSWPNQTTSTSQTGKVTVSVYVSDSKGKTGYETKTFFAGDVQCSSDPNEISGPIGYSEQQMVAKNDRMEYTILYENDPDFATAPATRVKITYPVESNQNLNSFRVGDFGFGDFVFTVPQNTTSYYKRLDVSEFLGVWVDVTAGIDVLKRELFWIFQSIDPQTGIEPISAQMGFLPINNKETGNGEGYVNFSILPANQTKTGDTILAEASIIFDDNAAIPTNVWSNVIDALPPVSSLDGNINDEILSITFSGQDDAGGSGIKDYKLYVSINDEEYNLYGYYLQDSICVFSIEEGYKYKFFSIAEDKVGNVEAMKSTAELEIGNLVYSILAESNLDEGGSTTGSGEYNQGQAVNIKAIANNGYVFSHWTVSNETVSYDSVMNFTAKESNIFVANFIPECLLIITANPVNSGTGKGDSTYVYGNNVHAEAIPNEGYRFVNWSIFSEIISNQPNYDFIIYNNTELTANFELKNYDISVSSQTGGTTKGDTSGIYSHFDYLEIIAQPESCYSFVDWSVNDSSVIGDTLRIEVTEYLNIIANYVLNKYKPNISVSPTLAGLIEGDTLPNYNCGEILSLEANPAVCYNFKHWIYNSIVVSSLENYDLTISKADTLIACFELKQPPVTPITASICQGDYYNFGGEDLTDEGIYRDTLQTVEGCDSIIQLTLTVNPVYTTPITASICQGDYYSFGGENLTSAGIYRDTLQTINDCDSIIVLTLTVNPVYTTQITASICQGDYYSFAGENLTSAGIYRDTLQTVDDCDSIIVLTLTVNPVYTTPITASICQGDYYSFGGDDLTSTGTYRDTLQTVDDCDSVIVLTLTVKPVYSTPITASICQGDYYSFGGENLTSAGIYRDTLQTVDDCDSIIVLTLTVNPVYTTPITASICQGDYYSFGNENLTSSGIYRDTLQTVNDCDSIIVLTLTVDNIVLKPISASICNGGSYDFYGDIITSAGVYPKNIPAAVGCDTLVTLALIVNPLLTRTINKTICAGATYDFYGTPYTEPQINLEHRFSNTSGCDSVVTLNLAVIYADVLVTLENNTLTINQAGATYKWFDCNNGNAFIEGANAQSYTPVETGNYAAQVTYNGCVYISECTIVNITGLNPPKDNNIVIFPNPAKDVANIQLSGLNTVEVMVTDFWGKTIETFNINAGDALLQINVSSYPEGTYIVRVVSNETLYVGRFVVKH